MRHGPSRGLVIGLTVGGLALGGAVAAALFLAFRSSDSGTPAPVAAATVVQTVAVTQPSAPATTPAAASLPVVTAADMENVLGQYESAYSSEDIQWLGSLFAPNFVRQNGNDAPQDRAAALETYQQQFSGLTDPQYRLSNVHYTPGRGEGTAGADYTIEHAGGTASGTIGFHFVVRGGNLLIDEIAVMPA